MAFCRRILASCGEQLVRILSVLLGERSACGITANIALMLNARDESRRAQEAVCASLEALRTLAKLFCVIGMQNRCAEVFRQLTAASCLLSDVTSTKRVTSDSQKKAGVASLPLPFALGRQKLEKLHAAHALSLDLVLSSGLEMSSHAADCWPHVFHCCSHIAQLEHAYFSATGVTRKVAPPQLPQEQQNKSDAANSGLFHDDDDLM